MTVLTHPPRGLPFSLAVGGVRSALRRIGPDVVHARQSRAAVAALRAGVAPVVADLRGIRPEEYLLAVGKNEGELAPAERRTLATHRSQQSEALAGAAAVVCVSAPFSRHLGRRKGVFVIPNVASPMGPLPSDRRDEERRRLKIGPADTALVYSGSLAAWQCVREGLRLFRELSAVKPETKFVLLTQDAVAGRALLDEEGLRDAQLLSLTPEETRRVLPAFDLALLLRLNHPVNRVSSPVKFAEYLHAGLPVVLTAGIGDASRQVSEHGLGVVLPSPVDPGNAAAVARTMPDLDGEACRLFARRNLTFERILPRYLEAFSCAMR